MKVKAENLDSVEKKLQEKGCVLSDPIHQEDVIYSDNNLPWESSKEGQVVMRIRRQNDRAEFNLKQQRSNELDNTEHETEVSNPEAIHRILSILGYEPQVEVRKTRRKCMLGEYEVCLDEVDKLGAFVEIEKLTNDEVDPKEIQEELLEVLESLGLSRNDQEFRGYDTQIYELKHSLV